MKRAYSPRLMALCCFGWFSCATQKAYGDDFIRGDVSTDGKIGITDAAILGAKFSPAGIETQCEDAMDIDDDGNIELSDFALLVEFLTELSETTRTLLEDPFPFPGTDNSPDLLDCQVGSGSDPGSMNTDYIFDWDVPPQSGFVPGTEIDIFLEVTLLQGEPHRRLHHRHHNDDGSAFREFVQHFALLS